MKDAFDSKGAVILGISFDSVEDNAAFAEKYDFNFRLLSDTSREVGLAYGATDPGSTRGARRQATIIGPDGKVFAHWPRVDASAFPQQALEALP